MERGGRHVQRGQRRSGEEVARLLVKWRPGYTPPPNPSRPRGEAVGWSVRHRPPWLRAECRGRPGRAERGGRRREAKAAALEPGLSRHSPKRRPGPPAEQRQRGTSGGSCRLSAPWFNQKSAKMTDAKYFQEFKSTESLYV